MPTLVDLLRPEKLDTEMVVQSIALRTRSGEITSSDPLVCFLYLLMRGHVAAGVVEELAIESSAVKEVVYTNGFLATYAKDVAARLREIPTSHVDGAEQEGSAPP